MSDCGCDAIIQDGPFAYSPEVSDGARLLIRRCAIHEAGSDLLAALKIALPELNEHNAEYHHVTSVEKLKQIENAIAKAEGRA